MKKETIKITGMTCAACAARVVFRNSRCYYYTDTSWKIPWKRYPKIKY